MPVTLLPSPPSSLRTQLWVYGSSFESSLVAVVVPRQHVLQELLKQQGETQAQSMDLQVGMVAQQRMCCVHQEWALAVGVMDAGLPASKGPCACMQQ